MFSAQIVVPPNTDNAAVQAIAIFPVGMQTLVGAISGDPDSERTVTFPVAP